MSLIIKYNGNLRELSNANKKSQTIYERKLWYEFLKQYPVRFRQQFIVGKYIVDFYCRKAKLAVELDGSQHFFEEGIEKDRIRTKYLEEQGITVLRFSNYEVENEFEAVCLEIDKKVKAIMGKVEG